MSLSIHTIKALPDEGGWSVGYYGPIERVDGTFSENVEWVEICQFKDIEEALRRVNILNGGPGIPAPAIRPPWESEPE